MNLNGDTPVTRYELGLALDPMKDSLAEVRADVKHLLAATAGSDAVSGWQRWFFGTLVVGGATAIGTVLYVALGAS